jgi:Fe2+ or Zn2+ uptake regulation protein
MTEAIRRSRNFQVHLGHLTITGLCPDCSAEEAGRRSLADA